MQMNESIATNLIDVTWRAVYHWQQGHIKDIPYEDLRNVLMDIAEGFEKEYGNNVAKEDYIECVRSYTDLGLAKALWSRFGDIPMDPDTEEIEEEWNGFEKYTFREDIWHWFEDTFNVSVAIDLMKVGD